MSHHHDEPPHPAVLGADEAEGLTRRRALLGLGSLGLAGIAGGRLAGLTLPGEGGFDAVAACTLSRELTQGPYYLDLRRIRRTITEGKAGLRLDLRIKVIDAATCAPVANAAVDIWHAAADGTYSGFAREGTAGETWMRGIQLTNASGVATFRTIYPGWYQGRATHIHLKAHLGGTAGRTYRGGDVAHTGQLFFQDATTDRVARLSPYSRRTTTRVRNAEDSIYRQAGSGAILKLTRRGRSIGSGFTGRITLGIET